MSAAFTCMLYAANRSRAPVPVDAWPAIGVLLRNGKRRDVESASPLRMA